MEYLSKARGVVVLVLCACAIVILSGICTGGDVPLSAKDVGASALMSILAIGMFTKVDAKFRYWFLDFLLAIECAGKK